MEIYITTSTERGYESLQRYVLSLNGMWSDDERVIRHMDDEDRGIMVSAYPGELYMHYMNEEDVDCNHIDFHWEQETKEARATIYRAYKEVFPEGFSYEERFVTIIEDPEEDFSYGDYLTLPI